MKSIDEKMKIIKFIKNINEALNKIGVFSNMRYENDENAIKGIVGNKTINLSTCYNDTNYLIKSVFRKISEID